MGVRGSRLKRPPPSPSPLPEGGDQKRMTADEVMPHHFFPRIVTSYTTAFCGVAFSSPGGGAVSVNPSAVTA